MPKIKKADTHAHARAHTPPPISNFILKLSGRNHSFNLKKSIVQSSSANEAKQCGDWGGWVAGNGVLGGCVPGEESDGCS